MKKLFKKKEPTPEELRDELMKKGVPVSTGKTRPNKFAAFDEFAADINKHKKGFAPNSGGTIAQMAAGNNISDRASNPYAQMNSGNNSANRGTNPYAHLSSRATPANPYSSASGPTSAVSDPYSGKTSTANSNESNPYADVISKRQNNNSAGGRNSSFRESSSRNVSGDSNLNSRAGLPLQRTETSDTLLAAKNELFEGANKDRFASSRFASAKSYSEDDYNSGGYNKSKQVSSDRDSDFNFLPSDQQASTEQLNESDEEVESIKRDIRNTKLDTLSETRNFLQMANQAELHGQNTLGMLGSQGASLYSVEKNLSLADTQNQIANDQAKEIAKLNRSIFAVHVGNPFNSKSRLREKEAQIKLAREEQKYDMERQRQSAYESEQRIRNALENRGTAKERSEVRQRYDRQRLKQNVSKYQFEADEEDDQVEEEIHNNLSTMYDAAVRLKGLAVAAGEEIDSQNRRLDQIERDTDKADIKVHLNRSRFESIH